MFDVYWLEAVGYYFSPVRLSVVSAWFPVSNPNSFDGFYSEFAYTCISGESGLCIFMYFCIKSSIGTQVEVG